MKVAGPLYADQVELLGQAVVVARLQERIRERVRVRSRAIATSLIERKHAGHVYGPDGERRHVLIETIRAALGAGRVTLYVHGFGSNGEALRYLHGTRLPEHVLRGTRSFIILPATDVWPIRADPTETLELIDELHALGARAGQKGVQIITEAPQRFVREHRTEALYAMEEWWNRAKPEGVNLSCLYRSSDLPRAEDRDRFTTFHGVNMGFAEHPPAPKSAKAPNLPRPTRRIRARGSAYF